MNSVTWDLGLNRQCFENSLVHIDEVVIRTKHTDMLQQSKRFKSMLDGGNNVPTAEMSKADADDIKEEGECAATTYPFHQ